MTVREFSERAMEEGHGILRLAPAWVPRVYCIPGRRIKLHPDDYYALGPRRGGINERWLSSTTPADNGPETASDEGLSYAVLGDDQNAERVLFRDLVDALGSVLIGERLWTHHGKWPIYSKFFDNQGPLPHHIHHRDQHAERVGALGKPEAYYFPVQLNNHGGDFPHTYFGLNPGTTREEVRSALLQYSSGDNMITSLSRCYRLQPGTGWDVPPGILHAPGSLCTYEPQRASDVYAQYQSVVNGQVMPESGLWKDTPADKVGDYDYLMDVIDWELNVDPDFHLHRFMRPLAVRDRPESEADGYVEDWICYRSDAFSAKRLTVLPGRTVVVRDAAAYGMIVVQGHGTMGVWDLETPALIRFGQLTYDEYFVSESAAQSGVRITNPSRSDPLEMLKHFGPQNPDLSGMASIQ